MGEWTLHLFACPHLEAPSRPNIASSVGVGDHTHSKLYGRGRREKYPLSGKFLCVLQLFRNSEDNVSLISHCMYEKGGGSIIIFPSIFCPAWESSAFPIIFRKENPGRRKHKKLS